MIALVRIALSRPYTFVVLALKSGNFGGPEFFSYALKLMR